MAVTKIPPQPVGSVPGSGFWNDWIEKMRTAINDTLGSFESPANKNAANGYAGLNASSRITKGADTTDDLIVDSTTKGLVLKSPNAHYWRETISNAGVVTWTDLGTTKP